MTIDSVSDSPNDSQSDESRRREFRRRQLFAQAQELFTAGEFAAAQKSLQAIPSSEQTADVARLAQLINERLNEIAELHRDIRELHSRNETDALLTKLQRLLELQPGDERALNLRHQLEERRHSPPTTRRVKPVEVGSPSSQPRKPTRQTQSPDQDPEEELWQFGEKLVSSPPPPLPGTPRSQQPVIEEFEQDDSLISDENSTLPLWIALAVSGFVILTAIIVTTIVLLLEYQK